jgi:hypothetical protein
MLSIEDQLALEEVTTFSRFKAARNLVDKSNHRKLILQAAFCDLPGMPCVVCIQES